ncbi:uncharacterized protein BDW43DRAFT_266292 [Aspergillus alliaceus]|uniref:uncharacterized protein n=1 Tax=Petromyces alliaceus TaxID=209559 RepID=UPI0012A3C295|nr:uncharacterized protein BDW43DRAFT_266292 [Aspergillus alliaceus]KAB8236863.1 hypothetical protein BDW43DRAFT_266292 [Aspergillus alliaceus]
MQEKKPFPFFSFLTRFVIYYFFIFYYYCLRPFYNIELLITHLYISPPLRGSSITFLSTLLVESSNSRPLIGVSSLQRPSVLSGIISRLNSLQSFVLVPTLVTLMRGQTYRCKVCWILTLLIRSWSSSTILRAGPVQILPGA